MKKTMMASLALTVAFTTTTFAQEARAQQVPLPTTAAQVPGPAPGTPMTKLYVQAVARMAYVWGWPLVDAANRAVAFSKAPEPGLLGGADSNWLPAPNGPFSLYIRAYWADKAI